MKDGHRKPPGITLLLLACVDAALQVLALAAPRPFQGIGVLAFPLLPVIGAYFAVLLVAIIAGIPLAIAFLRSGEKIRVGLGVALAALTIANVIFLTNFIVREREAARVAQARDATLRAEMATCTAAMARANQDVAAYFAEPRKVVALASPFAVGFENGMRVRLPPIVEQPQLFRDFFYDRLMDSQVRVVPRAPTAGEVAAWCRAPADALAMARSRPLDGDVYLADRKIDVAAYRDPGFPRQPRPEGYAGAPSKSISRWFDAATGDRTYSPTGAKPVAGYVREGQPIALRAAPAADSLGLYLCNAPLHRPDSPEHFLSTDEACEGQEKIERLGHISPTRDGRTPRALLRCRGTVQSPLRTGPRHLITTDVRECSDKSIERVLGYVEG